MPAAPATAVVVVAAGSGTRVGASTNKVLLPLLGRPVLSWSLRTICALPYVDRVVVVVRRADVESVQPLVQEQLREGQQASLVEGGATRHDSEWRGLRAMAGPVDAGEVDVVAVHDAARPLASTQLFEAVVRTAVQHGGALPVRPQHGLVSLDPVRHVRGLVGVQTPQAFRAAPLLEAYRRADADGFTGTDTASCVAAFTDLVVTGVPAPATNLKVTFPEDVALAETLLSR